MEKDRSGWLRFNACHECGTTTRPIYYYARTNEYLCENDIWFKEREVPAKQKIARENKLKSMWDELTSLS